MGSLVKIKLNESAGSGSGLRGCVDMPASDKAGIQKLQLVRLGEWAQHLPWILQIFPLADFLLTQSWKQDKPLLSVFMWVLCASVLCVDRYINMCTYILYSVNSARSRHSASLLERLRDWVRVKGLFQPKCFYDSMKLCLRDGHRRCELCKRKFPTTPYQVIPTVIICLKLETVWLAIIEKPTLNG